MQELLHSCGERTDDIDVIKRRVLKISDRWYEKLRPAILRLAEQTNEPNIPDDSAGTNGKLYKLLLQEIYRKKLHIELYLLSFSCIELTLYCIQFLAAKLKSRSKIDLDKRMKAIVCFAPVSIVI